MRTSRFQFSNPILSGFQFVINDTYNADADELSVKLGININKKRIGETEAIVELTVKIGEKDNTAPFYIEATEGANFKWEKEAFDSDDKVERFLDVNAPALLLSYLRPIVANITIASKYPAYNIPFINFNEKKE